VPRSELAGKISAAADSEILRLAARKWFYDTEVSAVAWGPVHYITTIGHYNRAWKMSTVPGLFSQSMLATY